MSHNVTIKDVKINDITALKAAVAELAKEGVKIALLKDAKYRGYSSATSGSYPYVISLPDSPYDIGLNKNADGSYSPVFDPWQGHIRRSVGVAANSTKVDGTACDLNAPEAHIGRLMQRYTVCKAEQEASMQGLTTSRHYDKKTNQYQLEVVGY